MLYRHIYVWTKHSLKTKDSLKIFSKRKSPCGLRCFLFYYFLSTWIQVELEGLRRVSSFVFWLYCHRGAREDRHSTQPTRQPPSENSPFTALGDTVLRKSSGAKKELLPSTGVLRRAREQALSFYGLQLSCPACGAGVKRKLGRHLCPQEPSASRKHRCAHLASGPRRVQILFLTASFRELCDSTHRHTQLFYTQQARGCSL